VLQAQAKVPQSKLSDIYDDYFFCAIKIPLHFGFRFRELRLRSA